MDRFKPRDPPSDETEDPVASPPLQIAEPHFTAQEFARRLNVHVRTLRRWVGRGDVAALLYGRSIRFSHAEVERVLTEGTHRGCSKREAFK